jgi:hypothetical protein
MVSQEAFFDSVVQGDTQAVISALAWVGPEGQRVHPTEGNNYAVREAAKHAWKGHGDKRVDPTASANAAVMFAALSGHRGRCADVVGLGGIRYYEAGGPHCGPQPRNAVGSKSRTRGSGAGVAGVDGSRWGASGHRCCTQCDTIK